MSFGNYVTLTGNVVRDPEIRETNSGSFCTEFTLAWNRRDNKGRETAHYFDIACFHELAENVADCIRRGDRITVCGSLNQHRWETHDGDKRSRVKIYAEDVSASTKFATVDIERVTRERRNNTRRDDDRDNYNTRDADNSRLNYGYDDRGTDEDY